MFALIDTPNADRLIGGRELIRALAWCDYLRTHANRLYAAAVMPEMVSAFWLMVLVLLLP